MIQIYLIRHGQTRFNQQKIVQGWNDSPLTEQGIYQAKCTGYGLRNTVFTKAFSGDTMRQIHTAETIMKENLHPIKIIPDPHFREMCYGKYEGGSYYEMLNPLYEIKNAEYNGYDGLYHFYNDIEIATELFKNDETERFEGYIKSWERISEGLDTICKENTEGTILISTSSFAICTTIYHLFPDFKQPRLVSNASVTIISYDGSFHLLDYNNTDYRKEGETYFSF